MQRLNTQVHAQYNVVIRDTAQAVVVFVSTTKLDILKRLAAEPVQYK